MSVAALHQDISSSKTTSNNFQLNSVTEDWIKTQQPQFEKDLDQGAPSGSTTSETTSHSNQKMSKEDYWRAFSKAQNDFTFNHVKHFFESARARAKQIYEDNLEQYDKS